MGSIPDLAPESVEVLFTAAMQGRGYRKKGLNWSFERDALIVVLNLQTSGWNDRRRWGRHYLNIASFIRALDSGGAYESKVPPEFKGHIRLRAGHLLPGGYVDNIPCLDDTVSMSADKRRSEIISLLDDRVLPVAEQLTSIEGIANFAKSSIFANCLVTLGVEEWLKGSA